MRYYLHSSTRERCLVSLSILDKRCLCCCFPLPPLCCCSTLVSKKGTISLRFIQIFNYLLITGWLIESNYSIFKTAYSQSYLLCPQTVSKSLNFNAAFSQSPRSVNKQHLNFSNFNTAYSQSFYSVSKQYLSSLTLKLLIVRVSLCP